MIIRTATSTDVAALSELAITTYTDAFGYSMQASDLAAHIARQLTPPRFQAMLVQDTILVAVVGNQLIGFIQFGALPTSADTAGSADQEVRRLYVQAAFQRQGIGTQLLQQALAHPQLLHARRIFLDVWEHNHAARRLYERFGFQVVGARAFEVESGAASSQDLIMVRQRS